MPPPPAEGSDACYISRSEEHRCQTDEDGQMRCTTLKRVWRHCPGQPPQELESEHSTTEAPQRSDAWPESRRPDPWGQRDGQVPSPFAGDRSMGDVFGMFAQMEAQMESLFRGLGGMGGGMQLRPPVRAPQPRAPPAVQVEVDEV